MVEDNFTTQKEWRNSLYYRFFTKKIYSSDNIDIVNYYGEKTCFQYFDFALNENDFMLLDKLNKRNILKFRYINKDSNVYKKLNEKFNLKITDEWESPIIEIKRGMFNNYCDSKSKDFMRLLKKCNCLKKNINIKKGNKNNYLDLWKDILLIDQNSWKYKKQSDMMNLSYEHISYILMGYNKKIRPDLLVAYIDKEPIAYSLLFFYNNKYYAVKWGATEKGRENNAGIICLLSQMKRLSNNEDLYIDLWGRNNKIYDRLRTSAVTRLYFMIEKNGNKSKKNR